MAAAEDMIVLAKQAYFTIVLDESLGGLEAGLEDDGFKVVVPAQGLDDDILKRKARGWAILTKNSQDFVPDAVRYDYGRDRHRGHPVRGRHARSDESDRAKDLSGGAPQPDSHPQREFLVEG